MPRELRGQDDVGSAWAFKKYITTDVFNPELEQWTERGEIRRHAALGADQKVPDGPGLKSREKSKCTRLANVKTSMFPERRRNEYD